MCSFHHDLCSFPLSEVYKMVTLKPNSKFNKKHSGPSSGKLGKSNKFPKNLSLISSIDDITYIISFEIFFDEELTVGNDIGS